MEILGGCRLLVGIADDEVATVLTHLWDTSTEATWNRNRAAI
jgi:hypothetical protein